ncbi:hypothetical protein C3489_02355 [Streptomyces sp. Ru71]|uniref:TIR domain-containing protein n=1 Tax=Streptomyces sp. Ru71 TaxID=2080746 RepID=UPI000CDE0502|nr:TIR domain-containing protein [Streptomyces sp. Ru71]POX57108.1 hypothetical protein C3489_02355 [Streptomyces sp. Ru71]
MGGTRPSPVRVFISYAHDDDRHIGRVREFWRFLRGSGIDAQLDLPAGERRQDWALWMLRGVRESRFVIVVASPQYKRRAEGDAAPGEGAGVQWEAGLLRTLVYTDPGAALERIVPVVLPGGSADDLPVWLGGPTRTWYGVEDFTVEGAEPLLRLLTDQPYETEPALGPQPYLPPRTEDAAPLTLPPPVHEPSPVEPPQPPPPSFVMPGQKELTEALLACPRLSQLRYRHTLLALMGEELGLDRPFDVEEDPSARLHLAELARRIRRTLLTPDAVLKALYVALLQIQPDDVGTERVRKLLAASGIDVGEA